MKSLKQYANEKGIQIIGDIPIYVAYDSADAWSNPALFQFDNNRMPTAVAGCPPDGFTAAGQLWGNPLYLWDYHRATGFEWWIRRISKCFEWYDMLGSITSGVSTNTMRFRTATKTLFGAIGKKGRGSSCSVP